MDQERVNRAVSTCLEQCRNERDVIGKVASFLASLKTEGGWGRAELLAVEFAVLRILRGLANPGNGAKTAFEASGAGSDSITTDED